MAGGGQLPAKIAAACRATGRPYFVLAFEGAADPATVAAVPHAWVKLNEVGRAIQLLHDAGVGDVVLAGPVKRPGLGDLVPDGRGALFLAKVARRWFSDDGLLSAVIHELEDEGFTVVGADSVLAELAVGEGPCGAVHPTQAAEADIVCGVAAARAAGRQAVAVRDGLVVAYEDSRGTAALLADLAAWRGATRAGVLVKVATPGQERRVDLPTIGPDTVAQAAEAGLAGIAVEAGGALILDRREVARAADAAGLFVVGVRVAP